MGSSPSMLSDTQSGSHVGALEERREFDGRRGVPESSTGKAGRRSSIALDFLSERAAKRRKLTSDVPAASHASKSNHRSKGPTVSPSKFYAPSSISKKPVSFLENLQDPVDFRKALRIDVTSILSGSDGPDDNISCPLNIKCRLSIALFPIITVPAQGDVPRMVQQAAELLRKTQTGRLEITHEHGVLKRKLIMEPIVFSAQEMFVNRTKDGRGRSNMDGPYSVCDLADNYRIQITLEHYGQRKDWPPLELPDYIENERIRKDLVFYGQSPILVGPQRQKRQIPIFFYYNEEKMSSSYTFDAQIQWSLPNRLPSLTKKLQSRALLEDESKTDLTKQAAQDVETTEKNSLGRATRKHVVPSYNLKTLSAQAQGKSPRKPRSGVRSDNAVATTESGPEVTFSFARKDSLSNGIKQQYSFHGLTCPFCHASNRTIDMLRLHLHNEHDKFKFSLRHSEPVKMVYHVDIVKPRQAAVGADARTFQLGKPSSLFNLEKYLNGDDSWMRSREGLETNHWPAHLMAARQTSSSGSSRPSRYSSPNTNRSNDDSIDIAMIDKSLSRLDIPGSRPRLLVPKTKKPLFHTITKQVLNPGDELPDSDDETSEEWFLQKHRDLTNDFEDVTEGEKEYTHQWAPFAMKSTLPLPELITSFVETYQDWFAESSTRRKWLTVHVGTLIQRGVVTENFMFEHLKVIRKAEARRKQMGLRDAEITAVDDGSRQRQRGIDECICCEHVSLVDRLVCVGVVSDECAQIF